ncbi:MAG: BrnA antitoxin family protein [Burkholderiales bacterium]|nr:BrnA antitoxin family protein [Burkholderiales bacterium]
MQIKSKSGRTITLPTPEEDAAITAAALSDPDNLPWTDEQLAKLKLKRPRGRPFGSGTKEQVTLRIDREVLESFKGAGEGWQTRMNDALKDWLSTHKTL